MYGKDLIPTNLSKQKQDSDSKRYLNKTDYATIKIAELMVEKVISLCNLNSIDCEDLKEMYSKYKDLLEKRKMLRNEI